MNERAPSCAQRWAARNESNLMAHLRVSACCALCSLFLQLPLPSALDSQPHRIQLASAAKISERTPLLPSGVPPDASGSSDSSRSSSTGDSSGGRLLSPRARLFARSNHGVMSDAGTPLIRAEDRTSSPTPGLASPSAVNDFDDGTRATSPRLQRVVGQFDGVSIHNIQQSVSPPDRGSESPSTRAGSESNESASAKVQNNGNNLLISLARVLCIVCLIPP